MRNLIAFFIFSILFVACRHGQQRTDGSIVFNVALYPAFHEKAEIYVSKSDNACQIRFLLKSRETAFKRTQDTVYLKSDTLSKAEFERLDSMVIQKIKIKQPEQWKGCCDGMPVKFELTQDNDTSRLYFRSPDNISDSIGYKITKAMVDDLRMIYKDSVIEDYLDDIESYMDQAKKGVRATDNRAINKLRKIEYGFM